MHGSHVVAGRWFSRYQPQHHCNVAVISLATMSKILLLVGTFLVTRLAEGQGPMPMPLPRELSVSSDQLVRHFCSTASDSPSDDCQHEDEELCLQLWCGQQCIYKPGAGKRRPCPVPTQEYVCEYDDAVVCSNAGRATCIHKTEDDDEDTDSLCACKAGTSDWSLELRSSCNASSLDVVSLAVACILAVGLLTLILALSCCVWKRGLPCGRTTTRSSSPESRELGSKGVGPWVQAEAPDRLVPENLEYSYAYGHPSRAPVADPELETGPGLDELQEDHYYSRLKPDGSKNGTSGKQLGNSGTRPETGHPGGEGMEMGRVAVQQGDEKHDHSTGYEVAQHHRTKYVTPEPSNHGSPGVEARPRDSGYEVATVQKVEEDKRHSYVTLEPPAENPNSGYEVATVQTVEDKHHEYFTMEPPSDDSGYVKVTELDRPEAGGAPDNGWSADYDHLERPGPNLTTDGANITV